MKYLVLVRLICYNTLKAMKGSDVLAETNVPEESSDKLPETKKKKKKRTAAGYALELLIKLAVTAAAAAVLLIFVGGIYVCHDNYSYPMIKDGDLCVTYRLSSPVQGDVIAYSRGGKERFGRVIASGGDTVEIFSDHIAVNGYGIFENTVYPTPADGSSVSFPYKVPEGCLFVLNDHRSDLSDSRTYGGIPEKDADGKVVFVMRRRGI